MMITGIHTAMVGIGYSLLVLFFAMGVFQSAASFRDFQRPEFVLRHLIRLILAKVAVGSCMEIMAAIFSVCGGVVATVMDGMGGSVTTAATLPNEIVTAIEGLGLLTNMSSETIISSVASGMGAACVLAIDASACTDIERLCSTVQLTNSGMQTYWGTTDLSLSTLGVPVISICDYRDKSANPKI